MLRDDYRVGICWNLVTLYTTEQSVVHDEINKRGFKESPT